MNFERFVLGDPRFLSGGRGSFSINYNNAPPTVPDNDEGFTSKEATRFMDTHMCSLEDAIASEQQLHGGISGYHHRPLINLFLRNKEEPTAGIEIETVAKNNVSTEALHRDLKSNWFHFETDGSLPTGGHELITEPLPPHVYRDPHVWAGLQNLLTPWVESYGYSQTGLHVHVGLRQFEDIPMFVEDKNDRRQIGKFVAVLLYFSVLDRSFVDRVMLRKNTCYCAATTRPMFQAVFDQVRKGDVTCREFMDYAIAISMSRNSVVNSATKITYDADAAVPFNHAPGKLSIYGGCSDIGVCYDHSGEGSEMNASHSYTVEFRRGKGTLHSLSVHRIVELTTLVVRYAGHVLRKAADEEAADAVVTPKAMYSFIAENTNNAALKALAESEAASCAR